MIIYSKTLWGLPLLSRIYGSALPRALGPAVVAGLITLGLTFVNDEVRGLWGHPFAYNAFVLLVSFVLTFRSNYAYQRHWEAYSNMQTMASKWVDAAMQIAMFDRHPQRPDVSGGSAGLSSAELAQHRAFVAELVHLISLLHAVSCQALRRDPDLHNLTRHSKHTEAPPSDPALLRSSGSSSSAAAAAAAGAGGSGGSSAAAAAAGVASPASPTASSPAAAAAAAAAAAVHPDDDPAQHKSSGIMSAWGRGTNIVGSANWRDIFMLRGSSEDIRRYNAAQPLPVIGGSSLDELAALGCSRHFYSSNWQDLSPQQQKQQQQVLPRARSLSQLFTAVGGSGREQQRGSVTGGASHSYRRSNSNLSDMGGDDVSPVMSHDNNSSSTAAAAAAANGMVTEGSWGGPVLGRFPTGSLNPAPPSTVSEGAHSNSSSSGNVGGGCWPRQKHKQPQQQQQHQQQQWDAGVGHAGLRDDQQQQQQQQGGAGGRDNRRLLSADGGLHKSSSSSSGRPHSAVISIPPAAGAAAGGGVKSKSFSFPRRSNSSSGGERGGGGAAAAAAAANKAALKRVPSTRFVLISRNCSCCKGHLPYMDRPLLVMAWLHELLLQRQTEGGLRMPAPILSRVYACLSDGLQGFEQCRKLADTPFPFPWAQFVLVMLVLFTFTLPLLILAYVPNNALAVVLTVVTVATYWTVNEVARDVEDPFLYEPNDMPLANSQYHVNELLLSLAHTHRPSSSISSLRRAARTPTHTLFTGSHAASKQQQQQHQQQHQHQHYHHQQFQEYSAQGPIQPPQQQQQQQQQQHTAAKGQPSTDSFGGSHSHADPNAQQQRQQQQQQQQYRAAPAPPNASLQAQPAFAAAGPAAAAAAGDGTDASSSIGHNTDSSLVGSVPAPQQQQQQQQQQGWQAGLEVTPYPQPAATLPAATATAVSPAAAAAAAAAAPAGPLGSFGSVTESQVTPSVIPSHFVHTLAEQQGQGGVGGVVALGAAESSLAAWNQQQQQQQQQKAVGVAAVPPPPSPQPPPALSPTSAAAGGGAAGGSEAGSSLDLVTPSIGMGEQQDTVKLWQQQQQQH